MKRFEVKIALGTVVVTVFEDRTVIELIGAENNETDALFQVPFTRQAEKTISAAMEGELPAYHGDLRHMEPEGHA